jgi:sterol desaturase/sphingolipid hydroxylase (fatty acid hydroxylase superfamily)
MAPEGILSAMTPGAGFAAFVELFALVMAAILAVLLGTGLFFEFMNARHPDRKVQKDRDNQGKWRELAHAPGSLITRSFFFASGLFAQWQGWALTPLPLTWWSGALMLVISILLYDAWFYWFHRLLHWRPLLRFHALHHTSIAPRVWTNYLETVIEALLNHVYWLLIVFVLPVPWQMLALQKVYDQISGMLGHAGYEHFNSPFARRPWPLSSTIFHDQHHSSFRFNFGHTFSVWDRIMGTLHPRYDETVARFGSESRAP